MPAIDIFYFEYLDHGYSTEEIKDVLKKPLTLWCVGYILKETPTHYIVANSGAKYRKKKPEGYELIVKSAILKKEKIETLDVMALRL